MAPKKSVVVTDIVGVAEDVKRENAGVVIRPKNTEELVKSLEYLFLDKSIRQNLGINAYNLVKSRYTWEKHADIVEKEYLKAMR